jgi:hypothetical protein
MEQAFESEQQVTDMLSNFEGTKLEWCNGTLFYECELESTARSIWHYLVEKFGLENVRISRFGYEYAVDFV